jgi:hypothetical protein
MTTNTLTPPQYTPAQLAKQEGRALLNFLTDFVTFDETEAMRLLAQIAERLTVDFETLDEDQRAYFEKHNICLNTHKAQEAKSLRLKLLRQIRESGVTGILLNGFTVEFRKHTPQSFCAFIGLKTRNGEEPITVIGMANAVTYCIEKGYVDYAAQCLLNGREPFSEHDYAAQQALSLLHHTGLPTPFEALKNI